MIPPWPQSAVARSRHGSAVCGGCAMARPKLSPREIVQRLQTIDALTADGVPVAEAIRSAGVLPGEYDRWRIEYNGLCRTLGPLVCAPPRLTAAKRRTTAARARKAPN